MKSRSKSEAELLRARLERRVMSDIMEEQESSEEEILRRQLRRLRGQDIQDLRDIQDQKIQQLRIRCDLEVIQIILFYQTQMTKHPRCLGDKTIMKLRDSDLTLSRNSQSLTIKMRRQ